MKSTRHARYENRIHYRNRITEEIETEMMMDMKNSVSQVNPQWKASPHVENSQGWKTKHRNWITHQKSVRNLKYKES